MTSWQRLIGLLAMSLLGACASVPDTAYRQVDGDEVVVLVHGFSKHAQSMEPIGDYLAQYGYRFISVDYPSGEVNASEALALIHTQLAGCCDQARRIHFVGHSIGGLLIRAYLAEYQVDQLGNVVLIATPNAGSEFVEAMNRMPGYAEATGPLLQQMVPGEQGIPAQLPLPDYPVGVIAGSRTHNPLSWLLLPGDDDGAVSVSSTRMEGMQDFLVVPANHHWLRHDQRVLEEVLHFIQYDHFKAGEYSQGVVGL